ncbi:hypothetical protein PINS_up015072 [Pythium insidiosum]|nr:hypothetical protein PINS_up015072 [Pythium insidiosum]
MNDEIRARGMDPEQIVPPEYVHRVLGVVLHRLGDDEAGLRMHAAADKVQDPASYTLVVERALELIDQQRSDLAAPLLQNLVNSNLFSDQYEIVARILEKRNLPRAAEAFYVRAIQVNPALETPMR